MELAGRSARYVLRVYTILESAISKVYIYRLNKITVSRPYLRSRLCDRLASLCLSVVCTECTCSVAKRCVLEPKLLLTAYRKSNMGNRLVPK